MPDPSAPPAGPQPATGGRFAWLPEPLRRIRPRPGRVLPILLRCAWYLLRQPLSWAFVAGAVIGALVVAGLTGALPWPQPAREQGVELHIYGGEDSGNARHNAITTWSAQPAQATAHVRATYHSTGATADRQLYGESAALDPASPTPVDLVVLDLPDLPRFARAGKLLPVDDLDTPGFLPAPLAAASYAGHRWGLPLNTDAPVLAYNVDLLGRALRLDRAGLHRRYETAAGNLYDLVEADGRQALAGQRAGGRRRIFDGQFADYEGFTVNVMEQLLAGGEDTEQDTYLQSPQAADALRGVTRRLHRPGFLADGALGLPDQLGTGDTENDTVNALADGDVLFARMWPAQYSQLLDAAESGTRALKQADAVVLPHGILGGQVVAIAAKTRHPALARQLIRFLTGELTQFQLFQDGGYVPALDVVYHEPDARARYGFTRDLPAAIEAAVRRPAIPYYFEYSRRFRDEIRQALDNDGRLAPGAADRLRAASDGKGSG